MVRRALQFVAARHSPRCSTFYEASFRARKDMISAVDDGQFSTDDLRSALERATRAGPPPPRCLLHGVAGL